jgi:hypothetical protein
MTLEPEEFQPQASDPIENGEAGIASPSDETIASDQV